MFKAVVAIVTGLLCLASSSAAMAYPSDSAGVTYKILSYTHYPPNPENDNLEDLDLNVVMTNEGFTPGPTSQVWKTVYHDLEDLGTGYRPCPASGDDFAWGPGLVDLSFKAPDAESRTPGTLNSWYSAYEFHTGSLQAVCVYIEVDSDNPYGTYGVDYRLEPIGRISLDSLPINYGMTNKEAVSAARIALGKKYGKSWKRGTSKRIKCVKWSSDSTKYGCSASWKYRAKKRKGTVVVRS